VHLAEFGENIGQPRVWLGKVPDQVIMHGILHRIFLSFFGFFHCGYSELNKWYLAKQLHCALLVLGYQVYTRVGGWVSRSFWHVDACLFRC